MFSECSSSAERLVSQSEALDSASLRRVAFSALRGGQRSFGGLPGLRPNKKCPRRGIPKIQDLSDSLRSRMTSRPLTGRAINSTLNPFPSSCGQTPPILVQNTSRTDLTMSALSAIQWLLLARKADLLRRIQTITTRFWQVWHFHPS
jgi:hypothetical protein